MNNPPKYTILEAKSKLEAYCAYQERCALEITTKLKTWYIFGEDQDFLLVDLITNNFLNEERFAEAYTSGKFRIKKWGKLKIKLHLKSKQISDYSIKKAINTIDEDEYLDTLNNLANKKWKSLNGSNWGKSSKLKRYLYLKGYENQLINDIVFTIVD